MNPAPWIVVLFAVTAAYGQTVNREAEAALGRQIAAEIRRASPPLNLPGPQAWIDRVGKALAQGFRPDISWSFELTSDVAATEAMAAPGGFVFIPPGAILAAADEREFMRTLAHQMAHAANPALLTAPRSNSGTIPLIYTGGWTGHGYNAVFPQAFARRLEQLEREAEALASEAIDKAGDILSGEFTHIQDLVRGRPKPQRRPPSLYRK